MAEDTIKEGVATGILGKKLGMTQIFTEDGRRVPVTVLQAGPCPVLQVKTKDTDGYWAVQLGLEEKSEKSTTKPLQGHFRKAGAAPQRFVREVPRLASTHDIERLKQVVARQMYAALIQIVLLAAPPILFFVGLVRGVLGIGDVLLIIVPSTVILIVAASYKKVEARVRQLPTADDELARQRNAIVNTWIKKPLPDW